MGVSLSKIVGVAQKIRIPHNVILTMDYGRTVTYTSSSANLKQSKWIEKRFHSKCWVSFTSARGSSLSQSRTTEVYLVTAVGIYLATYRTILTNMCRRTAEVSAAMGVKKNQRLGRTPKRLGFIKKSNRMSTWHRRTHTSCALTGFTRYHSLLYFGFACLENI